MVAGEGRNRTRVLAAGASTDTYSYLGSTESVVRIANSGGTTTDSLVDAGGQRLGVKVGTTVNWFVPDLHGSIAGSLTADETKLSNAIRYDAYGEAFPTAAQAGAPAAVGEKSWKHQGRLDLSPTGLATPLYDAGARDYAPGLGAFTSLDTVLGSAQDPLSMNRFLYAEANPATLIDPDGHCARYIDDFCADKGVSSSARVQHFRGTSANDRTTKRVPFTPKRSTQRAPAVRDNPRDDPWAPPTIASYNGLSNDDRNAYWMANGKNALAWLADHADTDAILDNPSAYVIGRDYSFGLDRAYGTLEAARAGHPGEISVNPNAGLDPNLYMTGATEIAWAQSDHANVDSLFAFGPVGMAYAGVSDAGGGLGSGEREVTGAGPSNFADREIGGGGSLGSGQPQRLLVEPAGAYPASEYRDTTWPRSSTFNRSTNVTASEFQRNLANDGWMGTSSRSGTSYTRDGNRYFVYPVAKSTRGPAAAYTPAGFSSETLKIRLGGL